MEESLHVLGRLNNGGLCTRPVRFHFLPDELHEPSARRLNPLIHDVIALNVPRLDACPLPVAFQATYALH